MNALARLGMVSESPSSNQTVTLQDNSSEERKDYFITRDGVRFAGVHLLVDLWGAQNLDDPAYMDKVLREAAVTAGATILHSHFHHFTPNGGVSGVVVLAESHISVHTWPEAVAGEGGERMNGYAAMDVFMCGACDPHDTIRVLRRAFLPKRLDVREERRGVGV